MAGATSFSFGVIADVQWADQDDGTNYDKTVRRCYRGALKTLQNAGALLRLDPTTSGLQPNAALSVYHPNPELTRSRPTLAASWWSGHRGSEAPAFIAQLGDLIDGKNAQLGQSESALDAALAALSGVACPKIHLLGNHELYNFNRKQCAERLNTAPSGKEF